MQIGGAKSGGHPQAPAGTDFKGENGGFKGKKGDFKGKKGGGAPQ